MDTVNYAEEIEALTKALNTVTEDRDYWRSKFYEAMAVAENYHVLIKTMNDFPHLNELKRSIK